jgi:hypothetical protein
VSSHDAADEHHDATVPTDASSDVTRADAHVEAQVDGPCNFATFVIDLIEHQTTPTALPSANLGQSCTDDENPAEFAILFQ